MAARFRRRLPPRSWMRWALGYMLRDPASGHLAAAKAQTAAAPMLARAA